MLLSFQLYNQYNQFKYAYDKQNIYIHYNSSCFLVFIARASLLSPLSFKHESSFPFKARSEHKYLKIK
jgi:hypothetical protein